MLWTAPGEAWAGLAPAGPGEPQALGCRFLQLTEALRMWVKLDDQFPDHPKLRSVGALGLALQTAAICYCGRYLTDGFLPFSVADSLIAATFAEYTSLVPEENGKYKLMKPAVTCGMSGDDAVALAWKKLMVEAQLWDETEGGFLVHDYLDFNLSKRQYVQLRKKKAIAGQAGGQARARNFASTIQAQSKPSPSPSPSLSTRPPIVPHRGTSDGFEPFWALYPRKAGKGAALKAWTRLHPTNGQCEAICAAVQAQLRSEQWAKNNGQFIPHPATWLNQRRWEDEPPVLAPHGATPGCPTCGWDLGHSPTCARRT